MATYQYDPMRVVASWGEILLTGFADGSMISVEYDEDAVTKTVGSQGDGTFTVNANRGGRATFNLLQGSPVNDLLSAACASNRPRGAALVTRTFTLVDLNGTTLVTMPISVIAKVAGTEFAKDQSPRSWVIDTTEMVMHTGGSTV